MIITRESEAPISESNGTEVIQRLFDENNSHAPEDTAASKSPRLHPRLIRPETGRHPYLKAAAIGTIGSLAVAGIYGIGSFAEGVTHAGIHPSLSIVEPGKGTVVSASTVLPPIPLGSYSTNATAEAGFHIDVFNIPIDQFTRTVEAKPMVATPSLDSSNVEITYDSTTDHMTIDVSKVAISNVMSIPIGDAHVVDSSTSPTAAMINISKSLIEGTGASNIIPLLEKVPQTENATENLTVDFGLLYLAKEVDAKCTPEVVKAPGFMTGIIKNIKTVVVSKIFKKGSIYEPTMKGIVALMDQKGSKIQELVDNATMILPPDNQVGLDQNVIDNFNKLSKIGHLDPLSISGFKCDVPSRLKVAGSDTPTPTPTPSMPVIGRG